jgi:hypothetical protein
MTPLKIAMAAAVLAFSVPTVMTTSASAYQCKTGYTQVQVHMPTRMAARKQARKSWSLKVKNDLGLAWSVWKIAKHKSNKCNKSGQRWICKAKAKPCLYVVQ